MKCLTSVFLALLITAPLYSQVGELVWEDNFNNGLLNSDQWSYEVGTGVNGDWGTGQLDRATDRVENVSFADGVPGAEDGCLAITTRKEQYSDRQYTSGRIKTAGKASWGPGHRIAARVFPRDIKHPGQGFAFWMMPEEIPTGWNYLMWPQGGEIDIMEYVGAIPHHNLGSVHYAWSWQNNEWADWNHGHQGAYYSYQTQQVPNPLEPGYGGYPPEPGDANAGSSGFHTYGIDWYPDRIEFFVDDNVYHIHYLDDGGAFAKDGEDTFALRNIASRRVGVSEYSNHFSEWQPFEHKMYAILSAGVGGSQYTYGGAVVAEAQFPCTVYVDWVRVYELDIPVAVEEARASGFQVYPNPAQGSLKIRLTNPQAYTVKIIDLSGKPILQNSLSLSTDIDISALPKGMYLVVATNGKHTLSRKVVVE